MPVMSRYRVQTERRIHCFIVVADGDCGWVQNLANWNSSSCQLTSVCIPCDRTQAITRATNISP
ncbi:MAG: hypothetical protein ABIL25_10610, partial [candidate division WOR-3 bacterium]